MLGILGMVAGLGCLICFIIVLIKQFQNAGVVHGIIGIVTCGIWTFIWGWMNGSKLGLRNIMLVWTVLIVISMACNILGGGFNYSFGTPATP
jgi:vacuolar-type H+-ATPase subunit I/STV1